MYVAAACASAARARGSLFRATPGFQLVQLPAAAIRSASTLGLRNLGSLGCQRPQGPQCLNNLHLGQPHRVVSTTPTGSSSGPAAAEAPVATAATPDAIAAVSADGAAAAKAPAKPQSPLRMYAELCKARLSSLVVFTSGAGYLMAGAPLSWPALAATVIGTSLAAGAAGTFNQVWEVRSDAMMKRTQTRPLPSGRCSVPHAMAFGAGLTAASAGILLLGTNPLTAALGIGNVALYSLVYTPLKQRSTLNTAVGAIVGAIPPVMGWAAATGGLLAFEPMLLGAALFWWQFPHFYSLAWNLRKDYARGGYAMVPVLDATGGKHTAWLSLRSTIAMSTLPVVASVLGVTSPMFAVEGVLLNGYFLRLAWRFYRDPSDASARALFRASLWYLPLLLVLMVFHSRRWHREEEAEAAEGAAAGAAGAVAVASADGATGAVDVSTATPGAAAPDAAAAVASKCPYGYKAAFNARDLSELAQRGVSQMHAWGRAVCLHELMVRQHITSAYDGASAMGRAACRLLFGGGSGGAAAAVAAAAGTEAGAALGELAAAAAAGGSEHAAANPAAQLRARCPVVLVEEAVQPAAALVQHAVADAAAAAAVAPAIASPAASGAAVTVESR